MTTTQALIVEDEPDLALVFSEALLAAGYAVDQVADGQAALDYLRDHQPELVVLDLHLPRVGGRQVLRHIRTTKHLEETLIIIASADARMADDLRQEATLVLVKPIRYAQMRDLAGRLRRRLLER